ncbi:MAG: hypothetical protein QXN68_03460 [Thermoplasmata archaeon]
MKKYAFSQSLDNISPDIMLEEESMLSPDSLERKKIANMIFNVTKDGKVIFQEQSGIKIYKLKNIYIANLPTDELDVAGRKTSVTFLFIFDDNYISERDFIKNSLENYMKKILTLCKKSANELNLSKIAKSIADDLQKKIIQTSPLTKAAIAVGLAIIGLMLIYLMRR